MRVTYDDHYLYIRARMFEPAPDSIISALSRRDVRTNSDQFGLVIDSYHDGKTAFEFYTNPAGVKRDYYVSNDQNEDEGWDAVWDVATRIDSVGWVAEFRGARACGVESRATIGARCSRACGSTRLAVTRAARSARA